MFHYHCPLWTVKSYSSPNGILPPGVTSPAIEAGDHLLGLEHHNSNPTNIFPLSKSNQSTTFVIVFFRQWNSRRRPQLSWSLSPLGPPPVLFASGEGVVGALRRGQHGSLGGTASSFVIRSQESGRRHILFSLCSMYCCCILFMFQHKQK